MVRRRNVYDPLEPTTGLRWHVVLTMHRSVIKSNPIAPGTDLKRLFIASMLEWIDEGWTIAEFTSTTGTFFCSRGTERRMVTISASDPHNDTGTLYGPSRPYR